MADANLAIINLKTGKQVIYGPGTGPDGTGWPHGGGYDDIDFNNKSVYLSASAPTLNPILRPAIASLQAVTHNRRFLTGILNWQRNGYQRDDRRAGRRSVLRIPTR